MYIFFRILKVAFLLAIIGLGGYLLYTNYMKDDNKISSNQEEEYVYEDSSLDETVESPSSLIGKTFSTDEGLKVEFIDENTCKVENNYDSKRYTVEGTPKYTYEKIEFLKGKLTINYRSTKEEDNTLFENEYNYSFELVFTKHNAGNAEMNLVASQKETFDKIEKKVPFDKKSSITFKLK